MARHGWGVLLGLCIVVAACSEERPSVVVPDAALRDSGAGPGGDAGRADGATADAASMDATTEPGADGGSDGGASVVIPSNDGGPFVINDAGMVMCGNVPCACSDGIDQDADGLFDVDDPECVSPWDNDESSLATGIPGDNRDDACQDCFFDGNSGPGDDGCRQPSSCLTMGNPSSGQGNCNSCEQTDACRNFCQRYTPNGCDCFGCCTLHLGSNITRNVLLGSDCSIEGTTVSAGCVECIPSTSCGNPCGRCELCPGKTLADLPADCATPPSGDAGLDDAGVPPDGGVVVTPACELGEQPCVVSSTCPASQSCVFGCCIETPLL